MLKSESREIDGATFTVQQLPYMMAAKTLVRLGKSVGPALGNLRAMKGIDPDKSLDSKDIETMVGAIGKAFADVFSTLSEDEFAELAKRFLEKSIMGGKPLWDVIDIALPMGVGTLFKLLAFALEVNYGDFLKGLGGIANSLQAPPAVAP